MLEAIFFDLGDTLVDLGEGRGSYEARLIVRAGYVYDVLIAAGIAVPERQAFCRRFAAESEAQYQAALAGQRGIDIYWVMRRYLEGAGLPADDALVAASGEAYCLGGPETFAPLRSGVHQVLAELRGRGVRLGAISNTLQPARYMNRSLARRGLAEFFEVQVYSSEVGVAKPHPTIFRVALEKLGTTARRAVYVGDRLRTDVAGAQQVGMKGVLIEVAHRLEHDDAIEPDARIKELPELLDVLPRLGG